MPKPTVEVDFLGKEVTIDNDGTIEFEDKLTAEIIVKMRMEYLREKALKKMDKIKKGRVDQRIYIETYNIKRQYAGANASGP